MARLPIPAAPAAPPDLTAARALLRQHFGHDQFRPGQDQIISSILSGRDTLGVMPTGGGKSVCFQIPALLSDGLTVVISPLIALMKDQVDQLAQSGIRSAYINSTLGYSEIEQILTNAEFGLYKLIYVAPERFSSELFLSRLARIRERIGIPLMAIDEAHCISTWGHDFRPAYLRLGEAADALGRPPIIALTATATAEVRADMVEQLSLRNPAVFVKGFDRPNLSYSVLYDDDKLAKIEDIIRKVGGIGIVYAATRKSVESTAAFLRSRGIAAGAYHAGLPDVERKRVQDAFMAEGVQVVVATNAFGMGINKPNVRFVVHHDVPGSLEAYYQEAGRAGRDELKAYAVALSQKRDRFLQQHFIEGANPPREVVEKVYELFCSFNQVGIGDQPKETLSLHSADIEVKLKEQGTSPLAVRGAFTLLEKYGVLARVPSGGREASVELLAAQDDLLRSVAGGPGGRSDDPVLVALLRTVGGATHAGPVALDLGAVARRAGLGREQIEAGLLRLHRGGLIRYAPPLPPEGGATMLIPRPNRGRLPVDWRATASMREAALKKVAQIQAYAAHVGCRRNFILGYFGEFDGPALEAHDRCGICDNCLGRHRTQVESNFPPALLWAIGQTASELGGRFGRKMMVDVAKGSTGQRIADFNLHRLASYGGAKAYRRPTLEAAVDWLLHEGHLAQSGTAYPTVRLTEAGVRWLDGLADAVRTAAKSPQRPTLNGPAALPRVSSPDEPELNHVELFEALRLIRREVARAAGMPPYIIARDQLLRAVATERPANRDQMLALPGMGPGTFDKIGDAMLEAVRQHRERG